MNDMKKAAAIVDEASRGTDASDASDGYEELLIRYEELRKNPPTPEIAKRIAERKEAALKVDPETAILKVLWSNPCDPYYDFVDYLDLNEVCPDEFKQLFVRAPDSDLWLEVCTEFPSHIEQAINKRADRGEGFQEDDDLPNTYRFMQRFLTLPLPMQKTIKQLAIGHDHMRLYDIDEDGGAVLGVHKRGNLDQQYYIKRNGEAVPYSDDTP
jgi:hypothetical protein